jgi:hypothetical protein
MLGGKTYPRRRLPKSQLRSVQGEGERRLAKAIEMAKAKMGRRVVGAGKRTDADPVKISVSTPAAPRIKEFEAFLCRITHKNGKG